LELGAHHHDHLGRQKALTDQPAARRAHRLAQPRGPQMLDEDPQHVVAGPDLVDQPAQVAEREADRPGQRLRHCAAAVPVPAVERHQATHRVRRPLGDQRREVDLRQLLVRRAVEQARVEQADDPAPAQVQQLARDLAAEPVGRLEPQQDELHGPDVRLFGAHGPDSTHGRAAAESGPRSTLRAR
jgi:hypothetical protein